MAMACLRTCGSALPRTVFWNTSSTPASAAPTTTISTRISTRVKPLLRAAHIPGLVEDGELVAAIAADRDVERSTGGIASQAVELDGGRRHADAGGYRYAERHAARGRDHPGTGTRGVVAELRLRGGDAHEHRTALRDRHLARVLHLRKELVVEAARDGEVAREARHGEHRQHRDHEDHRDQLGEREAAVRHCARLRLLHYLDDRGGHQRGGRRAVREEAHTGGPNAHGRRRGEPTGPGI